MIDKIKTQLEKNKKEISALEKQNKVLEAMLTEYNSWTESETE